MSYDDHLIIYTFEEARQIIKCSKSKLRELLDSGEIKGFKLGKYNWRIPETSITDYIHTKITTPK